MKQITLIVLLISIAILSFGQRRIKKLEVDENGYGTNITLTPIKDEIKLNGLEIKIIPLSADELNSKFIRESSLNGKFEYSYYDKSRNSYFLKKRKKKREKSNFEFLYEGVEWLLDNEKIDQHEYDELVKKIIYHFDKSAGDEIYSTNQIISCNPYFIQDRYLSTFKIEISNTTQSHLTFNEPIIIQNGNSIYEPLSADFIKDLLQKSNLLNIDKSFVLERHNIKDSILIPPNSSIEKIFAVLPINYIEKFLEISFPDSDAKLKFEINKHETIINELYTFYEFNVSWLYSMTESYSGKKFSILKSNPSSVFLGYNELFIGEKNLNEDFEVFTLALYDEYLYYGRNSNLKGKDFIDKEKNRRKTITLKLERISDLRKKVKQ